MQKHEIDFYFKMVEEHIFPLQKSFHNLDKVFNDKNKLLNMLISIF